MDKKMRLAIMVLALAATVIMILKVTKVFA